MTPYLTWRVAGHTPLEKVNEAFGVHLGTVADADLPVAFDTIACAAAVRRMRKCPPLLRMDCEMQQTAAGQPLWPAFFVCPPSD